MIKQTREGVVFSARVKTGCPSFRILDQEGSFIIECRSPPRGSRANTEIVRELCKRFRKAEILRGGTSRSKLILLKGVTRRDLKAALDSHSEHA